jgi:catechol 2,3-dioxygenase-like lactoylglutathione lyase family enzyme
MTALRMRNMVLDCPDPRALAEFYRALLGWEYAPDNETDDPDGDSWLALLPPDGGPRLAFQRSDQAVSPWRSAARVHLDVTVPDLEAAHEAFVAAGAVPLSGTPAEEGHPDDPFRVYADPAGHPFCACLADPA